MQTAITDFSYPDKDRYIMQHDALLRKAGALQSSLESGQSVLTNKVLDFLQDWITKNIWNFSREKYSDGPSTGFSAERFEYIERFHAELFTPENNPPAFSFDDFNLNTIEFREFFRNYHCI